MRAIYLWYPHFLEFHKRLVETLELYKEWNTPLETNFTVKGSWTIPKDVLDFMLNCTDFNLEHYAHWFWSFGNGWTMCAVFTQNSVGDLVRDSTETEYTGECTMDVKFYFVPTSSINYYISKY